MLATMNEPGSALSPASAGPHDAGPGRRARWQGLLGLFLLSFALRLVWRIFGPKVIESEGVLYARVGENLAAGRGLVGLHEMGLQLLYPPLYEFLIALGVRLGFAAEAAGRNASFLFGVWLPVVICLFTQRLYGAAAGWYAGLLAAVHPLLIVASAAVLTESTYLTLALTAVWCVTEMLALEPKRPAVRATILAGALLGLAYLCRPEAFILTGLLAGAVIVANHRRWRKAAAWVALLLGVFSVFAVPYVAFLWHETGLLRFEAKTADGVRYAQREARGQGWGEIYFAVDENLIERGASNTSDLDMLLKTHATPVERVRIILRQAVRNFPHLLRGLSDLQFGQPMLLVLVGMGLFGVAWDRARLLRELPLAMTALLTLLTYCTWPFFHDRFLVPLLPALIVWGGLGMARVSDSVRASVDAMGCRPKMSRVAAGAAVAASLFLVSAAGAVGIKDSDEMSQSWTSPGLRDDVPIGQWLRARAPSQRVRVMDTGQTVAFYAGAVLVPFPWTDSATALRYIEHRNISYLVLRESDGRRRPYLAEWIQKLPTERLELVQTFHGGSGVARVYHWSQGDVGK
jgi:hypothetical protein